MEQTSDASLLSAISSEACPTVQPTSGSPSGLSILRCSVDAQGSVVMSAAPLLHLLSNITSQWVGVNDMLPSAS